MTPHEIATHAVQTLGAAQKIDELTTMLTLLTRYQPLRHIVEIGTAGGGALWAWCQMADDDATIVSVDCDPYWEHARAIFPTWLRPQQTLRLIRRSSRDPAVCAELPMPLDVLIIDGDHSYEGVKADYDTYSPLVRPGGLIVLHDIAPHTQAPECQVRRYWDEIKGAHTIQEILGAPFDRGWGPDWAGFGVVFV